MKVNTHNSNTRRQVYMIVGSPKKLKLKILVIIEVTKQKTNITEVCIVIFDYYSKGIVETCEWRKKRGCVTSVLLSTNK